MSGFSIVDILLIAGLALAFFVFLIIMIMRKQKRDRAGSGGSGSFGTSIMSYDEMYKRGLITKEELSRIRQKLLDNIENSKQEESEKTLLSDLDHYKKD